MFSGPSETNNILVSTIYYFCTDRNIDSAAVAKARIPMDRDALDSSSATSRVKMGQCPNLFINKIMGIDKI